MVIVSSSVPKPFKLLAGHPALELVNTLDLRFSARPSICFPRMQIFSASPRNCGY